MPKAVVLRHIHEELEICFKSLVGYLDNKRRAFPRFYFVSDPVLLALLSRPNDLESVRPHLRYFSDGFVACALWCGCVVIMVVFCVLAVGAAASRNVLLLKLE